MVRIGQYAATATLLERRSAAGATELLAERYERGFAQGLLPTVGLEEELILVDPESFAPVPAVERVLATLAEPGFTAELRPAQIELVMPVCLTVADLRRELVAARARLFAALDGGVLALGVGVHPDAVAPSGITDRPRYLQIARDYPWASRRGMPCGLHVHVAIPAADEALAVFNAARSYLPELAALAANSPFYDGSDSGLASSRLMVTGELPRGGIPPAFGSWHELAAFANWGSAAGLFPDLTYLWWDLRLRPEYGTLEFRVADTQTSPDDAAAIAAVCQSLVVTLGERYRAGEELPVAPTHMVNENRWLAVRDGIGGVLVDPITGVAEPTRERIGRLLLQLEHTARELGCAGELAHAWTLLSGNGAERQRAVAANDGMRGLLEWLAESTRGAS